MSKDIEQPEFNKDAAIDLGMRMAKLITRELDKNNTLSVKTHMYAVNIALQPVLVAFSKYAILTNGEDPIPEFLELVKKDYLITRIKMKMQGQDKNLN